MAQYTRRQCIILVLFSIAQFCNALVVSLQAPFFPEEAERKGATATQYSFVFGVFELVVFIASPIYGQCLDRIGVNFVNNAGIFAASVACICFGFLTRIQGVTMFLAFSFAIRIVEALGNAAFITTAFSIIAQEFPLNVASAFATLETFFGLGLIAGPALGGVLYELGGFTLPFVVIGCVLIVAALTVCLFLPRGHGESRHTRHCSVFALLRQPKLFLFALTTGAASLSILFIQATLEPHMRPLKLSAIEIGLIFVVTGLAYSISAPIWGRLCDKFLPERAATTMGALIVATAMLLIGPSPLIPVKGSITLYIVALVIHGLGIGSELVATFSGSHKDALKAGFPNDLSTYGLVSGMWTSSFALGAFIGPSIAGIMYDTIGFGWGTTCVGGLHIILAFVTILCSSCCQGYERIVGASSQDSLLLPSTCSNRSPDSTYGSIQNSTDVSLENAELN